MFNKNGYYFVSIRDSSLKESLGRIKMKNDERWEWWRWNSRYQENWLGEAQGVENSKEEAKRKVLDGWK